MATGRLSAADLSNGIGVAIFESMDGETFWPSGPFQNVVGGLEPGERNVISGNRGAGVSIANADHNSIVGNYIGTDCEGKTSIPNGDGVSLLDRAKENVIGPGNVISGNGGNGVAIRDEDNVGNIIGANAEEEGPLGNGRYGVFIEGPAKDNLIGGSDDDANVIAYNREGAIVTEGSSGNSTDGNSVDG